MGADKFTFSYFYITVELKPIEIMLHSIFSLIWSRSMYINKLKALHHGVSTQKNIFRKNYVKTHNKFANGLGLVVRDHVLCTAFPGAHMSEQFSLLYVCVHASRVVCK